MGFRAEGVGLARLEIACFSPGQPSLAPTVLFHWLRHQRSPRSVRVWIAIDPDLTARGVVPANIALGSHGIRLCPAMCLLPVPLKAARFSGMLCASPNGSLLGPPALGLLLMRWHVSARILGCRRGSTWLGLFVISPLEEYGGMA